METTDILRRSVVVTLGFCSVSTVVYAAAGTQIVRIAFGSGLRRRGGSALALRGGDDRLRAPERPARLPPRARPQSAFAWLLVLGRRAQIGLFVAFHETARQLVVVDIMVAAGLLVSHELLTRGLLVRTLRSG